MASGKTRAMMVLYLVPIVGLPIVFAAGAFLMLTSKPPAIVPLHTIDAAYTYKR